MLLTGIASLYQAIHNSSARKNWLNFQSLSWLHS